MSETPAQTPQTSSGFHRFLISLLRAIVRITLVLLTGLVLGAAGYFLFSTFYHQIAAGEQAADIRISALETRQAAQEEKIYQRIARLDEQILALENRHNLTNESLRNLYSEIEALRQESRDNASLLRRLKELETRVDRLDQFSTDLSTQVTALQLTPLYAQKDQITLQQEIRMLHMLELLNRSRMYLMQSNFGLAKREVEKAQQVLLELTENSSPSQIPALNEISKRLNTAYANLPDNPVLAADDLEIIWQMLSQGWVTSTPVPGSTSIASMTPAAVTITTTPTPTP